MGNNNSSSATLDRSTSPENRTAECPNSPTAKLSDFCQMEGGQLLELGECQWDEMKDVGICVPVGIYGMYEIKIDTGEIIVVVKMDSDDLKQILASSFHNLQRSHDSVYLQLVSVRSEKRRKSNSRKSFLNSVEYDSANSAGSLRTAHKLTDESLSPLLYRSQIDANKNIKNLKNNNDEDSTTNESAEHSVQSPDIIERSLKETKNRSGIFSWLKEVVKGKNNNGDEIVKPEKVDPIFEIQEELLSRRSSAVDSILRNDNKDLCEGLSDESSEDEKMFENSSESDFESQTDQTTIRSQIQIESQNEDEEESDEDNNNINNINNNNNNINNINNNLTTGLSDDESSSSEEEIEQSSSSSEEEKEKIPPQKLAYVLTPTQKLMLDPKVAAAVKQRSSNKPFQSNVNRSISEIVHQPIHADEETEEEEEESESDDSLSEDEIEQNQIYSQKSQNTTSMLSDDDDDSSSEEEEQNNNKELNWNNYDMQSAPKSNAASNNNNPLSLESKVNPGRAIVRPSPPPPSNKGTQSARRTQLKSLRSSSSSSIDSDPDVESVTAPRAVIRRGGGRGAPKSVSCKVINSEPSKTTTTITRRGRGTTRGRAVGNQRR